MLILLALCGLACCSTPDESRLPLARTVGPIAVTVSEAERSIAFFTNVLGFTLESQTHQADDLAERTFGIQGADARIATLRLGEERLQLVDFVNDAGRPIPADSRSNDRWFQHIAIVVSDFDAAVARLTAANVVPASVAPQTLPSWNPNAGGIRAYYFKDPDAHVVEIIWFPEGKGDPRWHRATQARDATTPLFLGIDHTAIVTADTDRALGFYQHTLGLQIAGTSDNYGLEQERLNNVFGAHLRITTLRAASGPGIELLEYLTPVTGHDYPRDSSTADLWHWHVTVLTGSPLGVVDTALRTARAPRISAAPASPDRPLHAVLARDPDGHALLVQPVGLDDQPRNHPGSAASNPP